ncbi:MAG TPA: TlpA family protein disulfide reductase [Firmicutes bacterium]|nr:TlpA family protein disulfide reductase [Bacillota bacterium]
MVSCPFGKKRWIFFLIVALVIGVSVYLLWPQPEEIRVNAANTQNLEESKETPLPNIGVFSGNKAMDFTLEDADGNVVSLSDFYGRPIVLNFWATWCSPCKAEMPHMEKIWREYQEKGSDLVYLLVNVGESVETVQGFYEKNFFTMPVVYDKNSRIFTRYLFRGIPGTLFIDREGVIKARYNEMLPEATFRTQIARITGES